MYSFTPSDLSSFEWWWVLLTFFFVLLISLLIYLPIYNFTHLFIVVVAGANNNIYVVPCWRPPFKNKMIPVFYNLPIVLVDWSVCKDYKFYFHFSQQIDDEIPHLWIHTKFYLTLIIFIIRDDAWNKHEDSWLCKYRRRDTMTHCRNRVHRKIL